MCRRGNDNRHRALASHGSSSCGCSSGRRGRECSCRLGSGLVSYGLRCRRFNSGRWGGENSRQAPQHPTRSRRRLWFVIRCGSGAQAGGEAACGDAVGGRCFALEWGRWA
ncbi:hypothetical protein HMPREF0307_00772 [Corynebacterium sp. DNF00584]|nr:hypothetical protein HMPREF0307_00772 [Corynebacterium sp. DNF00584]